jgi:hypothetical protein
MDDSVKVEGGRSKYQVIIHGGNSDLKSQKINDLTLILDNWDLFIENRDSPLLDRKIKSAQIGSAYSQSSPVLTLRQLFGLWHRGCVIHKTFYDDNGAIIPEPLYMVGMGGSLLTGSYVFWGIVPSRKLIVIQDRAPTPSPCGLISNIKLYTNAAQES